MKVAVNNVQITPKMSEVLSTWYETAVSPKDNLPYVYVECLGDLQDLLCSMLDNEQYTGIKQHLSFIVNLKRDLKMFIPEEEGGEA